MARRTKVLWLTKGLGRGGAEKLLTLALPHVDRERYDYEVAYFLPGQTALVAELEEAKVPVFCLNQQSPFDPRGLYRLIRLLRERRPDVLHMHLPYPAILGGVASNMVHVPATVYTEHSMLEGFRKLTALVHRRMYSWKDAVICISEAVRNSIIANAKLNRNVRLRVIYNGVDWEEIAAEPYDLAGIREEFRIPSRDKLVVHVANFAPHKRHQDLLQAMKMVLSERADVTLLLVGDGGLRPSMEQMAGELGIRHKTVFAGSRPDAVRLIAASDLFVLPSLYEGLGICLLEAMARGRPIVATRVGGIPEVVTDQEQGILVDPCNPRMLADSILAVLADPQMQERFRRNGVRRLKERFDVKKMVHGVESLYGEVLSGKEARAGGLQPRSM